MPFYTKHLTVPNEQVLFFLRRHPFIFLKTLAFHFLISFLPIFFFFLFADGLNPYWDNPVFGVVLRLGLSAYYFSMGLFLFHSFIDYYLDIWIVTNERIMNIEQEGLFARTISELKLLQIQDVTSEIHGIFPTFLGYGSVYVQTAAEHSRFHFKEVSNPYRIAKDIMRLRDVCRAGHNHLETS